MRLIDADKLPWVDRVILVDQVDGDINITIAKEHTSYVNDETPTVKAIPIEWFKNLIKTVEDSKNYEESEILKWALDKWKNQEEENDQTN